MPGIPVLHGRADLTATGPCGLGATVRALLQGMGFNGIGPPVAKPWLAKAIGPLAFDEMPEAMALGAKLPSELPRCH